MATTPKDTNQPQGTRGFQQHIFLEYATARASDCVRYLQDVHEFNGWTADMIGYLCSMDLIKYRDVEGRYRVIYLDSLDKFFKENATRMKEVVRFRADKLNQK